MEGEPSRTAMATAVARARHRLYDDAPWVLDDPFALVLVGPIWRLIERRTERHYPEPVDRAYRAGIVLRSRYAEDRLVAGEFAQYVVLGAGLDAFVWRRPDLVRTLRVFEVDHPASQRGKRDRAAELGLPEPGNVAYVPVDFEVDTLADRLDDAGFDWSARTCFSWLGVSMYLTVDAIDTTLRTVARCGPGSEIVLTYAPDPRHLDDLGRRYREIAKVLVAALGEPSITFLTREDAEALCGRSGLQVVDHPDQPELVRRYFAGRPDGMVPSSAEAVLTARTIP